MNHAPTVREIGEFGVLRRIRDILGTHSEEVILGIGDDAAVIRPRPRPVVLSTDAMVEDIHFRKRWTTAGDLAYKAMASNVSDLAAKAAEPMYSLITLGLPSDTPVSWVEDFYRTLAGLREEWGIEVIGGDTVRSETIMVSITVWGYQFPFSPISQKTAQAGDRILVTGFLGDAAAGLELLEQGATPDTEEPARRRLIARFLRPMPRFREALEIVRRVLPTAMTDISDGLARDLPKLCEAGGIGAKVYGERLPCSEALRTVAERRAGSYAWRGGEDYELLLTLPPDKAQWLLNTWTLSACPVTEIGEILESGQGIHLLNWEGEVESGFDHFR